MYHTLISKVTTVIKATLLKKLRKEVKLDRKLLTNQILKILNNQILFLSFLFYNSEKKLSFLKVK